MNQKKKANILPKFYINDNEFKFISQSKNYIKQYYSLKKAS